MKYGNKKHILCLILCIWLSCLFVACDGGFSFDFLREKELSGIPVTKEVSLPYDESSGLSLSVELNITDSDNMRFTVLPVEENGTPHAEITYPKDFEDYGFQAEYDAGTLSIYTEEKYRYDCDVLEIVLYADLRRCTLEGAMDIEIGYMYRTDAFSLTVNGAANCEIEKIDCMQLDMISNGASAVSAEGTAQAFSLTINGAGDVEATELISQTCEVTINGAGNAEVYAETLLKVEVNGVGSVSYLGDPQIEQKIGGAGSVKKIQDKGE